eukprot:CAMPEP_0204836064 /NCGR_PEP_ID=MMETSP1346-20131115/24233_1 /ASSEMBLY_ACC=CAM_ASM_000771 /TAXON_ID=215587 /ORGANISM="Aplanochytrium stocchinoi, Strain GSBS06" /LENGTH=359 /DNA_ID=CAMNT_0051970529 /DNA_START=96 /DNA_END=1172 /DNA_ORIENTATION=+
MEITAQCIAAVVAVKERLNALEDFKEMRPQFYTLIPHVEYLLTQLQSERQLPPTVIPLLGDVSHHLNQIENILRKFELKQKTFSGRARNAVFALDLKKFLDALRRKLIDTLGLIYHIFPQKVQRRFDGLDSAVYNISELLQRVVPDRLTSAELFKELDKRAQENALKVAEFMREERKIRSGELFKELDKRAHENALKVTEFVSEDSKIKKVEQYLHPLFNSLATDMWEKSSMFIAYSRIVKEPTRTLGNGSTGVVFAGKVDGKPCAIKELFGNRSNMSRYTRVEEYNELLVWEKISEKNVEYSKGNSVHIVKLLGVSVNSTNSGYCFIMELCTCSLADLMYNREQKYSLSAIERVTIAL